MPLSLEASYEELPYDGHAFSTTHPDALAVAATLRGMSPPAVATARILELGCANGSNLIPMAYSLPESCCIGVDLSPRQIADGQIDADAIGLKNITLRAMSILDIGPDFGQFDYIICHGVFSWVPRIVQDKILEVCQRNLAPNGVAYISYNTYPGWHFRGAIRDMLKFHIQPLAGIQEQVQHSRALLNLMAKIWNHREPENAFAKILSEEAEELEQSRDSYVFHEHLEEFNEPLYFQEFMTRAESYDLQYLWDMKNSALARSLPAEELRVLDSLTDDLIRQEQYYDFLRRRVFRKTLLCGTEHALSRTLDFQALCGMHVTSRAKPVPDVPNIDSLVPVEFRTQEKITVTTNRPLLKRMLGSLYNWWPASISVLDLWETWQVDADRFPAEWMTEEPIQTQDHFLQELQVLYLTNVIELHTHVPTFATDVSERPEASVLARHLARRSLKVTNLRHFTVELDEFDRLVLTRLDGTLTVEDVLQSLLSDVAEGRMSLESKGSEVISHEAARELLTKALDSALSSFASQALLVR